MWAITMQRLNVMRVRMSAPLEEDSETEEINGAALDEMFVVSCCLRSGLAFACRPQP
jgi:hypothetical protein